jgi:hypothetical protein
MVHVVRNYLHIPDLVSGHVLTLDALAPSSTAFLGSVRSGVSNLETARASFDFIQRLIIEGPERCISVDNIASLVAVLDDFASAAGIAAEVEQQHTRRRPQSDSSR